TALHSYDDRVSREVERLSCDVQVLGRLFHEQLPAPPALSDDTRPCLEALRQENQLLHERVSSLVHDKTLLQDRVLLLETRIDQLSLDFSSRLAQDSIPAPEPSSGYPFQLPSELTALLNKIYSRQINLVDCANEYTRHLLASRGTNSLFLIKPRGTNSLFLIKPAGYRSLGRILSALEGCHLALVKMRMIHIKTTDLPLSFCGPFDVHVARELAPTTLRGIYGHTNMQNAVHCTDSPEDGSLETQFFFRVLA
ncbi:hypothetical protein DYB28_010105, partial [Aphanomyces astaci]